MQVSALFIGAVVELESATKTGKIPIYYANTGCGVFKGGIQNQKGFWLKINCSQMKLLNFENWSSGELSKIEQLLENQVI